MVSREFIFVGEELWLDFVNTEAAPRGVREDFVPDLDALADWLVVALRLSPAEVATWRQAAALREAELWAELRALRTGLREFCSNYVASGEVTAVITDAINRQLARGARRDLLVVHGDGSHWQAELDLTDPLNILEPIARSAAETLVNGLMPRVRKCDNHACILWFLDTSKNGKRRWCSMDMCGNRHKAARHYQRTKSHVSTG